MEDAICLRSSFPSSWPPRCRRGHQSFDSRAYCLRLARRHVQGRRRLSVPLPSQALCAPSSGCAPSPSIRANGGQGSHGGGGGGRIAIYATVNSFNYGGAQVIGGVGNNGAQAGQPGTIFAGNPLHPTHYVVIEGEEFSGDLASLFLVDGNLLSLFNDASTLGAGLEVSSTAPTGTPQLMGLTLTTLVDRPGLSQTAEIFKFGVQAWETFAGNVAVPAGLRVGTCFSTTAAAYVGPNREVKVRVRWVPINDEDPTQDGWLHSIDQIQWRIVP